MTRTSKALLTATKALTIAAIGAAFAVSAMTYDAPEGGWVPDTNAQREAAYARMNETANVPTFGNTDAASHRGAVSLADLGHDLPSALIVSSREGVTHVLAYTPSNVRAITATGDNAPTADDLYVVGAVR